MPEKTSKHPEGAQIPQNPPDDKEIAARAQALMEHVCALSKEGDPLDYACLLCACLGGKRGETAFAMTGTIPQILALFVEEVGGEVAHRSWIDPYSVKRYSIGTSLAAELCAGSTPEELMQKMRKLAAAPPQNYGNGAGTARVPVRSHTAQKAVGGASSPVFSSRYTLAYWSLTFQGRFIKDPSQRCQAGILYESHIFRG